MTSSSKTYNVAEAIETFLDSFDQCLILKIVIPDSLSLTFTI